MGRYKVNFPEYHDDGFEIFEAIDAEAAAEAFAERRFDDEPSSPHSFEMVINVTGPNEITQKVRVIAEAVINFYGNVIKDE